jgi:hypothetical protein
MPTLKQSDVVRVRSTDHVPVDDASRFGQRLPRVGDTGTIIGMVRAPGIVDAFMVKSVADDGSTLWVAGFTADALEVVTPAAKS